MNNPDQPEKKKEPKDQLSIAVPIIVTTVCTLLGIMSGGISVWSFMSSKVEEKTKWEMRVQAAEMLLKEQKDNLWTLRIEVEKEVDSNRARHEAFIERLLRLELKEGTK